MALSWNYLVRPADLPPAATIGHTYHRRLSNYIGAHLSGEYVLRKTGPDRWQVTVYSKQDAAVVRMIFPSAIEFDPGLLDGSLLMLRFSHELREMAAAGINPPAGSAHAIAQHMLSRIWSDRHLRRLTENLKLRMAIEFHHKAHHAEPLTGVYDVLMQMGQLLSL